jgi:phosphatidylglycerol---prolipoprotein diacylglyceryl transferase
LLLLPYAILIGLGASLGLGWSLRRAPSEQEGLLVNAGLASLLGSLLGGRMLFMATHQLYYQQNPEELINLPVGGLEWVGALGGGILFLALFARFAKQPLGMLADGLLPLLTAVTISLWLGCWSEGCAYGARADTWWAIRSPDEWGGLEKRFPVQPLGALLSLACIWAIDMLPWERLPEGSVGSLGLLGVSVVSFTLSFWRADPSPAWLGVRLDVWSALAFMALGLGALLFVFQRRRRSTKEEIPNS